MNLCLLCPSLCPPSVQAAFYAAIYSLTVDVTKLAKQVIHPKMTAQL